MSILKPAKCQYGVFSVRCGAPASTKRQPPAGSETWDVCARHAAFLDRLRSNLRQHAGLLKKLGDS